MSSIRKQEKRSKKWKKRKKKKEPNDETKSEERFGAKVRKNRERRHSSPSFQTIWGGQSTSLKVWVWNRYYHTSSPVVKMSNGHLASAIHLSWEDPRAATSKAWYRSSRDRHATLTYILTVYTIYIYLCPPVYQFTNQTGSIHFTNDLVVKLNWV